MDLTKKIPSSQIVDSSETTNVTGITHMDAKHRVETSFSVEFRSNVLTEKGLEIRIITVSNVLSLRCICSTCGKDFAEQTSITSHMKSHLQSAIFESRPKEFNSVNTRTADIKANDANKSCSSDADTDQSDNEADSSDTIVTQDVTMVTENCEVDSTASGKTDDNRNTNQTLPVRLVVGALRPVKRAGSGTPIFHGKSHVNISRDKNNILFGKVSTRSCLVSARAKNKSSPTATHRIGAKSKIQNRTKKPPLECNICGRKVFGKTDYSEHMNMHTGAKPYECSICGHSYRRKGDLNAHSRIHEKIDLHTCQECGKQFTKPSALEQHRSVHTGEKPYTCNTCGKRFRLQMHLNEHIRTHTGDRPHLCNICGKTFSTSSALTRHNVVHTGEKPHQCDTCGKRFAQLYNLKEHVSRHNEHDK